MTKCDCGSGLDYQLCCMPIITGVAQAKTAEALLRARFTAHVKLEVDFIVNTIHPDKAAEHDPAIIKEWAEQTKWLRLEIIEKQKGTEKDTTGLIEFNAYYERKKGEEVHSEVAQFVKKDNSWYFYDAAPPKVKQVINSAPKTGRNDPCICGSGKKFKKCCG